MGPQVLVHLGSVLGPAEGTAVLEETHCPTSSSLGFASGAEDVISQLFAPVACSQCLPHAGLLAHRTIRQNKLLLTPSHFRSWSLITAKEK